MNSFPVFFLFVFYTMVDFRDRAAKIRDTILMPLTEAVLFLSFEVRALRYLGFQSFIRYKAGISGRAISGLRIFYTSTYFMIKAESADKELALDVLSRSFVDNQSVNFIVRQDKKKTQRIRTLMDYSFELCQHFGEAWLSDDRKACALVLYPHKKHMSLFAIWLDVKLIVRAIGLSGIRKTLSREALVKKLQPKEEKAYLWFIGVDPEHQHRGTGSKLMKDVIANANRNDLPIYLETSTLKNLPWYENLGFQVYGRLDLGYTLYFLKREPDKQ